jgi:hypothetical protein
MQERPRARSETRVLAATRKASTPLWHSLVVPSGGNLSVPGDDLDCDGALAQVHREGQVTVNRTLIAGAAVHPLLVAAVRDRNPKVLSLVISISRPSPLQRSSQPFQEHKGCPNRVALSFRGQGLRDRILIHPVDKQLRHSTSPKPDVLYEPQRAFTQLLLVLRTG